MRLPILAMVFKVSTKLLTYFEKKSRDEGSRKDWFSQTFIEKNGEGFDAR